MTVTAPQVDIGTNENMNGTPTAAAKSREQFKTNKHNYIIYLPFRMTFVFTYENIPNVYMYACANGIHWKEELKIIDAEVHCYCTCTFTCIYHSQN